MACLCWDCFQSAASVWWQSAQASLPTKAGAGGAPLPLRALGNTNSPSARNTKTSPPIARAVTVARAISRGFAIQELRNEGWAPLPRASSGISAGLDVAPPFDSPPLLPALVVLRTTNCYPLHRKEAIPIS